MWVCAFDSEKRATREINKNNEATKEGIYRKLHKSGERRKKNREKQSKNSKATV